MILESISIDCNPIWTRNHLVHKLTLNYLDKLTKWLRCVVITYLYGTFGYMYLACYVHVSNWRYSLWLPECQRTPCLEKIQYLKFTWLQPDSTVTSDIVPVSSKEFLDIQATIECRFTLKCMWHDNNTQSNRPIFQVKAEIIFCSSSSSDGSDGLKTCVCYFHQIFIF